MPFNKEGEWVTFDPLGAYRDLVKKSDTNRGGGGAAWTSEFRNRLHDEATRFVMEQHGIPTTGENFTVVRERIGRELEEDFNCSEKDGLNKHGLLPEPPSGCYKRIGD